MKKKLQYKITYQANLSDIGKKVKDFIVNADLGINDITKEETDIIKFTTSTKITQKYIDKMGEIIIKYYEENYKIINLTKPVITKDV